MSSDNNYSATFPFSNTLMFPASNCSTCTDRPSFPDFPLLAAKQRLFPPSLTYKLSIRLLAAPASSVVAAAMSPLAERAQERAREKIERERECSPTPGWTCVVRWHYRHDVHRATQFVVIFRLPFPLFHRLASFVRHPSNPEKVISARPIPIFQPDRQAAARRSLGFIARPDRRRHISLNGADREEGEKKRGDGALNLFHTSVELFRKVKAGSSKGESDLSTLARTRCGRAWKRASNNALGRSSHHHLLEPGTREEVAWG